ncbi:MAG: serine hydrolase domain-containing protein [Chitinophagales bacterium]
MKNVSTNPSMGEAETTFEALLQEAIDNSFESIPGVSMTIVSPDIQLEWSGAKGFDSAKKDEELSIDQPFRIASVTKTFVAAAILRLHEMDSLSIEEPIGQYISEEHQALLREDGYAPDSIKILHCLYHTSGLYDYAMGGSPYIERCKAEQNKRWTRVEQLKAAIEWGEKLGYPGEKYAYSDTGYILLGEILEKFYEGDLAKALRVLLKFEAHQMTRTWLETLEPEPSNMPDLVHRYLGRNDFSDWDASVDLYGGGGLVSTSPDLATFFHALFNHQIFDKKSTLDLMLTKTQYDPNYDFEGDRRYKDYRMGLWKIDVFGETAYLHRGLWGSMFLHIPNYNSTFAANFTRGNSDRMLKKTILVVKNLQEAADEVIGK